MRKILSKYEFVIFSVFTILISFISWILAKEQVETVKLLLTQFGYFGPALIAIILSLVSSANRKDIKMKSYLPLIAVFACIIIFAIFNGRTYYDVRIDKLLLENPLIIGLVLITVSYFIYQYINNKGSSAIDKLIHIPKTNMIWYILAIALYPLLKYVGVLLSVKLFSSQFELPIMNLAAIIPLFLFSIVFYAAIGEEIGWRGYALKKLQQKYNPFVSTLFIAVAWSIWHIGYFTLVENYSIQMIPSVIIWTIMASFFATWFYNKTKGNILILILFHASINFAIMFVPHPLILTGFHLILMVIVLITGKFFKKLEIKENDYE